VVYSRFVTASLNGSANRWSLTSLRRPLIISTIWLEIHKFGGFLCYLLFEMSEGRMQKDQYTAEQIALILMQGALGFEYYMREEFGLYDLGPDDDSRMSKPLEWVNHGERLYDCCQERIYALGLGQWEQGTFGDQLILDDFRPVAQQLASAPGPESGKVAFLALTTALVLKAFAEYVKGAERELADELRGEVETDLREAWGVDVARGIVNPALAGVHLPLARAAARLWSRRHELLTRAPLRVPFTEDQVVSLNGYHAAFERDPWFLCLVKGCGRCALHVARDGLHCPKCEYRRDWAWSWMADWSWRRRWDEGQEKNRVALADPAAEADRCRI
jgi:hypothetical protein